MLDADAIGVSLSDHLEEQTYEKTSEEIKKKNFVTPTDRNHAIIISPSSNMAYILYHLWESH